MSAPSPPSTPVGPVAHVDAPFWVNACAFSNLLPACIAAMLTWNSSLFQGAADPVHPSALAAVGTFLVYGVDRLRDLSRDRLSSPLRTNFIETHARAFRIAIGVASLALVGLLVLAPGGAVLLCGIVGLVGLMHRRLKRIATLKTLYVSFAWTVVCVGVPGIAASQSPEFRLESTLWLAWILFSALVANLIASSLRDGDAAGASGFWPRPLAVARLTAYIGVALAVLAPSDLVALAWIPAAEAFALAFYRPSEHYGLIVVDGALLVGAILTLAHQTAIAGV